MFYSFDLLWRVKKHGRHKGRNRKWEQENELRLSSEIQFFYPEYRNKILTSPLNKVRLSLLYSRPSKLWTLFVQGPKEGALSSPTSSRTTHPEGTVPSQNSLKSQSLDHMNDHCQQLTHPSSSTFSLESRLQLLCSAPNLSQGQQYSGYIAVALPRVPWGLWVSHNSPLKYLHMDSLWGTSVCIIYSIKV